MGRMGPRTVAFLGLLVLMGVMLVVHYGAVLRDPNAVLFAGDADGLKNYYAFLYHIRHDTGPFQFQGMNHPFGSHVLYTDGHPLLAEPLRWSQQVLPGTADHAVGVLNLLMLLGLPMCAGILFVLLNDLGCRPWYAAWSAFGITLLAPQIERIFGHFSLSWSMAVPLVWLMSLRAATSDRWGRWMCGLAVTSAAWWFVHPYLGFMVSAFGAFYGLFLFLRRDAGRRIGRSFLLILASAIAPVSLFELVLLLTDHHTGRTLHPSGFFDYVAEPDDVLFPHGPPLKAMVDGMWFGPIRQQWEAWCYIGLGTEIVLLAWLWRAIRQWRRSGTQRLSPLLGAAMPGALLLLCLAFCLPFKFAPVLLEWMPWAEQFRALGRFTWPFYFVVTVMAAVLVDRWSRAWLQRGKALPAFMLSLLIPGSWVIEGHDEHTHVDRLTGHANVFSKAHAPADLLALVDRMDARKFQAVLPMPLFNVGSESFSRPCDNKAAALGAMSISVFMGLPIMGGNLSRVPVPESKMLTQVVSPRYYAKALQDTLRDPRPLLVVRAPGTLTKYEQDLLRDAVPIDSAFGLVLLRLSLAELFRSTADDAFATFHQRASTMVQRNGWLVGDSAAVVIHRDMEDRPSPIVFRGKGALSTTKNGDHVLGSFDLKGVPRGTAMMATVWMYNAAPEALNLGARLDVSDATDGVRLAEAWPDVSEVIDGDWTMVELPFNTERDDEQVTLNTQWQGWFERPMFVDEILIRPADCDVYHYERLADGSEELLFNGHRITRPPVRDLNAR